MAISVRLILKGTIWTVGSFGLGQVLRFATNIVLARIWWLQSYYGIMLIVNSVTLGIELMSDVGIAQNIIYHDEGNSPEYYNTAWTLQALRSIILWVIASLLAFPLARFYHSSALTLVIPVAALSSILSGFSSVSLCILRKRMQVPKLMSFELIVAFIGASSLVVFAYFSPSIWALVLGSLFGNTIGAVGSYFLLPDVKLTILPIQTLCLGNTSLWEMDFWLISRLLSRDKLFDKLYLGKVVPLALLSCVRHRSFNVRCARSGCMAAWELRALSFDCVPLQHSAFNPSTGISSDQNDVFGGRGNRFFVACGYG